MSGTAVSQPRVTAYFRIVDRAASFRRMVPWLKLAVLERGDHRVDVVRRDRVDGPIPSEFLDAVLRVASRRSRSPACPATGGPSPSRRPVAGSAWRRPQALAVRRRPRLTAGPPSARQTPWPAAPSRTACGTDCRSLGSRLGTSPTHLQRVLNVFVLRHWSLRLEIETQRATRKGSPPWRRVCSAAAVSRR
jgi:hypothetical protein